MKKLLYLVATMCLCLMLPVSAQAAAGSYATDPGSAAQFLYDLTLFQGTSSGFELDKQPTRQEGVTLLVRLLGKEAEAKGGTWQTPFTDVDAWAKPYVGYAYANGLTQGVGPTTFGGKNPIDANQYATFLLRALGYTSGTDFQWNNALNYAKTLGLPAVKGNFQRGTAAVLSRATLDMKQKDTTATLASALVAQNIFTAQTLATAQTEEASGVLAATARKNDPGEARKAAFYQYVKAHYQPTASTLLLDLTHDGKSELLVVTPAEYGMRGYVLFLNADGTVLEEQFLYLEEMGPNDVPTLCWRDGKAYLLRNFHNTDSLHSSEYTLYYYDAKGNSIHISEGALNDESSAADQKAYSANLEQLEANGTKLALRGQPSNMRKLGQYLSYFDSDAFVGYAAADASLAKTPAAPPTPEAAPAPSVTPTPAENVYTIHGISFTMDVPEQWFELCTIKKSDDSVFFTYTRDAKSQGGYVMSVEFETVIDTNWDHLYTVKVDGGYLVVGGPHDIQYNHEDPISTKEYREIMNQQSAVYESIHVLP